jgi:general secretion pathway protein F
MPSFRYEALAADGRRIRGDAEASSAEGLRNRLRAEGLSLLSLQERAASTAEGPRLSAGERTALLQRLATLNGAGLPLADSLASMARQSSSRRERDCVQRLLSQVAEGRGLGSAMAQLPRCFPEVVSAAVAAGEGGGRLSEVLETLAAAGLRGQALERRLVAALAYPAVLLVVSFGVCLLLLAWVVPALAEAYAQAGVALPWSTRMVSGLSSLLVTHALTLALGALVLLTALVWLLSDPARRTVCAGWLLSWPLIGPTLRTRAAVRLCSGLALMLAGGVTLLESLRIASGLLGHPLLGRRLLAVHAEVAAGSSLARALEGSGLLPPIALDLVATGETTGRLPALLERAASALENELRARVDIALALLEPLLVVAVGAVVLLVVLSVMSPLAGLYELAG